MLKRLLPCSLAAVACGTVILLGCNGNTDSSDGGWGNAPSPKIVATFAPIQCFVMNVVGDNGTVKGILTTEGPHHGEPPTSQARLLSKADLFFSNGLRVDDGLVRKITSALGNSAPPVTKLGASIPKALLLEGNCSCCKDDDGHDHDAHKEIDGHVWLGIDQAKIMVQQIEEALDAKYPPTGESKYRAATQAYLAKLDKLKADGTAMLKDKTEQTILPFHGSLAYFSKSFNSEKFKMKFIDPIQDVPGQEPTAKQLDAIVAKCIKYDVRVIAVEPQYGAGSSAKAILKELERRGVKDPVMVVIDPLETATDGEMNADWYDTKMRASLAALAKVLK